MTEIRRIPYHFAVVARGHFSDSRLATPEAIAPLRHAVADYARDTGIRGEQLDGVRLAVSEAVTNVVLHAYRAEPGLVHVTVRVVEHELCVLVADDGVGLAAPAVRPGLGWGLAFITDACDDFTLSERDGGGAEARMVFRLPVASVAGAGAPEIDVATDDALVGDVVVGDSVVADAVVAEAAGGDADPQPV